MATELTVIVDTDAGQSPHYTSLAAAIAGETGASPQILVNGPELTTNDETVTFLLRSSSGVVDEFSSAIDLSAFNGYTDSTRYVTIEVDDGHRHGGIWDTSKSMLRFTLHYSAPFSDIPDYSMIDGMQLELSNASNTNTMVTLHETYIGLANCIINTNDKNIGVYFSGSHYSYIANTVFLGAGTYGVHINWTKGTVYNCHFIGLQTGIYGSFGGHDCRFINNLFSDCTVDANVTGTAIVETNCATDLDSGTSGLNISESSNRFSQTFSFTDSDNGDYSLTGSDAGARDHGTDLSSDPIYAFSDDITGAIRSGSWDIGAFEFIATGGGDIFESDFSLAIDCGGLLRTEKPARNGLNAGGGATIRIAVPAACDVVVDGNVLNQSQTAAGAALAMDGSGSRTITMPATIELELDFTGTVSAGGTVRAASIIVGANGGAARSDIKMSGAEIGMSGTGTVQAGMDAAHSLGIDAEGIMIRTFPADVRLLMDHATLRQVVAEAVAGASVDWPVTVHQAIVVQEILELISNISLLLSQGSAIKVQADLESRITSTLELESRI